MSEQPREIDQIAIDTLRFLAVDMVEAARSGHPGAPMGQAPLAYWLWSRYLRHHPANPQWWNRDRFVLSCGHASALIYGLLHLAGYDLPIDQLQQFRQLHSKTPGHPEFGHTPGVETTTGPLGQGLANAVGMAMAERMLAARFNRDGFDLVDHRIWVLASDGDLMEGVTAEACSMAGHLGLGKLKVFYDANQISIDGSTDLAFTEDVAARHQSYGWHTLEITDGTDLAEIDRVMAAAEAEQERPTLVVWRTEIGFGSPNRQGTAKAHGEPLGPEEARLAKENLGWPLEPSFHVPDEAREAFAQARERGQRLDQEWQEMLGRYAQAHPELAADFQNRQRGELPAGWEQHLPTFTPDDGPMATRKASGKVLTALADAVPQLIGGSADLAGSNKTLIDGAEVFSAENPGGRNLHFGVREHAMGSAMNGMALSGMLRPYGGTFLIFSDYMRPAIRLAALMQLPTLYVLTHDSIFLGEDGPTHQPISQLLSMRSIPGLTVFRPADANETAAAWAEALRNPGPTALVLTRQGLPVLASTAQLAAEGVARGAYVLSEPAEDAQAILMATGSEVALAVEAQQRLAEEGVPVRIVSMPCWSRFDAQDADYRESVLPAQKGRRLAIEAGSPLGWHRYAGDRGDVLAVEGFGASAPYGDLARTYGFTVDEVVRRVRALF